MYVTSGILNVLELSGSGLYHLAIDGFEKEIHAHRQTTFLLFMLKNLRDSETFKTICFDISTCTTWLYKLSMHQNLFSSKPDFSNWDNNHFLKNLFCTFCHFSIYYLNHNTMSMTGSVFLPSQEVHQQNKLSP